ncbi:putative reverse transcriptase domain-containing protein [Tanacetum coccineum]|uniref:Reverse transcriptase domain-containing protein n=1 Tax=Tanacetum coccineum TaxID=301880 RepID=A0ABQ5I746_9ASTR
MSKPCIRKWTLWVCSLEALTRLNSSTWATKWFKRLVAYAKCNRDSFESELGTMAGEDIDTLTMEQYLALTRENQASGVVKPKSKARYCPPSMTAKQLEDIHNFTQEGDEYLYTGLGGIIMDCCTCAILTTSNCHQKGSYSGDGTSSSSQTHSDHGLTIRKYGTMERQAGRLERVVAMIDWCFGLTSNKDCSLNEEVKQAEEVRFREFGRTTPFNGNNGGQFHVGQPGYYTKTDNRPPYGETISKHQKIAQNMSKKAPLGIVENVLVKINRFLFLSDFIIIDNTLSETIILGRPFLATIHAKIDVFTGKFSLGINEDRISFDAIRKDQDSANPSERIFMVNSGLISRPQIPSQIVINQN